MFWIALAVAVVLSNPVNTSRFVSLSSASILIFFYISQRMRDGAVNSFILMVPLISIIFLPITSELRHGSDFDMQRVFGKYATLEFSSVQMLNDGASYDNLLNTGVYTLSGFLVFVPRAIWPGKAESIGIEVADRGSYVFTNSALPPFFSAYADFGYVGLFLFSIIIGRVMRGVSITKGMNMWNRNDGYSVILISLTPTFVRGDWTTAMVSFYAISTSYEVLRFFSRFRFR